MKSSLINIAIDGHSSCGKSSIAKDISKKFKMKYVDSGAMYRAVTLFCLQNNFVDEGKIEYQKILKNLHQINISFKYNTRSEIILNGNNVENLIRDNDVSNYVSKISQIEQVRSKLISLQKQISSQKNVVMDGRDIGTKVMPNADIKLFITADIDVRANRRYKELLLADKKVTYDEVLKNLSIRDFDDTTRDINPLIKAENAIVIDNTNLNFVEQNNLIFNIIKKKINENNS
ncbi:MAG: cytidylate kinase [Flavobacteriales bacterium]|nr:cytidylate kinase [Flavobacteriales bacterium]OUW94386.1 MAG: cytidylate kinase [Flavobacteriales bacterium TMED228]|tara:strand:- start:512 stop:1207 length:696 start_codon:yes stop_codon:yes gene_type:complete